MPLSEWEQIEKENNEYRKRKTEQHITDMQKYAEIVHQSILDFIGIAEAYKHDSIQTEDELYNNFKDFLQEYTVSLLPITTNNKKSSL